MGRLAGVLRAPQPSALTPSLRLAVIVPTLNEERSLSTTLQSLTAQTRSPSRVVVCDGGSTDATVSVAEAHHCDLWFCPHRGRGNQIAYAVERLEEDVVVIAHADMVFPPNAVDRIERVMLTEPNCPGGCLGHRFAASKPSLKLIEWWDDRRVRWTGVSYGDQAQFFRRQAIADMGGFPRQPIMEDIELSRLLKKLGKPVYLDVPVTVSARRFAQSGIWRTVFRNANLRRDYRREGVPGSKGLYRQYYEQG